MCVTRPCEAGSGRPHPPLAGRSLRPEPRTRSKRARGPERAVGREDGEGRAPRPVVPAGPGSPRARPGMLAELVKRQAGSAMMRRRARSSTRIAGLRELHDLGSPCLSRSENSVELADRHESGVERLRRSPGCSPNDVPPLFRAGGTGVCGGWMSGTFAGRGRRPGRCGAGQTECTQRVGTVLRVIGDPRPCGPRAVSRAGGARRCHARPEGMPSGHVIRPCRPRPPSAAGRPAGT